MREERKIKGREEGKKRRRKILFKIRGERQNKTERITGREREGEKARNTGTGKERKSLSRCAYTSNNEQIRLFKFDVNKKKANLYAFECNHKSAVGTPLRILFYAYIYSACHRKVFREFLSC